jgi:hypothetical protein
MPHRERGSMLAVEAAIAASYVIVGMAWFVHLRVVIPRPGNDKSVGPCGCSIRCLKRYVAREVFAALPRSQSALDSP